MTIGAGVASIGLGAFSDCDELTEVTLRPVATGGYVFKGCDRLAKVNLGGMSRCRLRTSPTAPAGRGERRRKPYGCRGLGLREGCVALSSFDFHPALHR